MELIAVKKNLETISTLPFSVISVLLSVAVAIFSVQDGVVVSVKADDFQIQK